MTDHPERHVEDGEDDMGFVMIGETQIPIIDVHMCGGRITVMAQAKSPFPGANGEATIYGHDLQAIMHLPQAVSIPPLLEPGLALNFTIPLAVDGVIYSSATDV